MSEVEDKLRKHVSELLDAYRPVTGAQRLFHLDAWEALEQTTTTLATLQAAILEKDAEIWRLEEARAENWRLKAYIANRTTDAHEFLLVEALAEIKAIVDGESDQPVRDVVYGVLAEIKALPDKAAEATVARLQAETADMSMLAGVAMAERDKLKAEVARLQAERDGDVAALTSIKQQCETAAYNLNQREDPDDSVIRSFLSIAGFAMRTLETRPALTGESDG